MFLSSLFVGGFWGEGGLSLLLGGKGKGKGKRGKGGDEIVWILC
jgi:hypothetical protein